MINIQVAKHVGLILRREMSRICDQAGCLSWTDRLEHTLWAASMLGGDCTVLGDKVEPYQLRALAEVALLARCWPHGDGLTPLDEWCRSFIDAVDGIDGVDAVEPSLSLPWRVEVHKVNPDLSVGFVRVFDTYIQVPGCTQSDCASRCVTQIHRMRNVLVRETNKILNRLSHERS